MVFDLHLSSLRNANVKTLWEDDVHPHYVIRRYAEFTASLIHLNVEYGDGQVSQIQFKCKALHFGIIYNYTSFFYHFILKIGFLQLQLQFIVVFRYAPCLFLASFDRIVYFMFHCVIEISQHSYPKPYLLMKTRY